MQKNLVLRKGTQWFICPCAGREQEMLLSILKQEQPDFDPQTGDIYTRLNDLGWEFEYVDAFAA